MRPAAGERVRCSIEQIALMPRAGIHDNQAVAVGEVGPHRAVVWGAP